MNELELIRNSATQSRKTYWSSAVSLILVLLITIVSCITSTGFGNPLGVIFALIALSILYTITLFMTLRLLCKGITQLEARINELERRILLK
ncbi:MAG TPA: hypothetical protein V6D28_01330 [Leptolyngbyaceae cyanobacterium]